MFTTISLAWRNLSRQKQRSAMLAIAIAFGFFVVTSIDGLATGALNNLKNSITRMFGGNVIIQGIEHEILEDGTINVKKSFSLIRDQNFVKEILESNNIQYESYFQRSSSSGSLIFNGNRLSATVYGCDFANEEALLDSFIVIDGSLDNIWADDALIISETAQKSLNVEVGDRVIYSTSTRTGQKTVGEFTIAAITKKASLLDSIMLYAPQKYINELRESPENSFNMCTINLGPKLQSKQTQIAQQIEDAIRATGNHVTSRTEALKASSLLMVRELNKQIEAMEVDGPIYSVYSLEDILPALETVVSVVHTVTTIILIVIFLIVMVGISNTYRMVLYERIREIGTMRAVGLTGNNTGLLFTTEATILSLIGAFGGFVLAVIVMWLVGFFTIDNEIVAFFLHNGHISFSLDAGSVIAKYLLIMVLTVLAVRGTAQKASAMSPAEALRSIK